MGWGESLCVINGVMRSLLLSFHAVGFSIGNAEENLQIIVDVAWRWPGGGLAVAWLLSVPQLAALSAFALSSAEPKTGGSHRWSLCFIGSDTHILP